MQFSYRENQSNTSKIIHGYRKRCAMGRLGCQMYCMTLLDIGHTECQVIKRKLSKVAIIPSFFSCCQWILTSKAFIY